MGSLIGELASAAAEEKGIVFEEGIEDRLCAYARAVSHFPTAVKEVSFFFFGNLKVGYLHVTCHLFSHEPVLNLAVQMEKRVVLFALRESNC